MSSPEELTFVVGRWLRPIVVVLDVVRRLKAVATSSREQLSTAPHQLIRARFVRPAFRILKFGAVPSHFGTARRLRVLKWRGSRQPTTVASTMPPDSVIVPLARRLQRQAKGN